MPNITMYDLFGDIYQCIKRLFEIFGISVCQYIKQKPFIIPLKKWDDK